MKDDLTKAKQRAFRYWYVDGIFEAFFGLFCLLLGGYFWLQDHLSQDSWLKSMLIVFFVLFILGSSFILRKTVNVIKNHLTYPRTGYVAYLPPKKRHNWLTALLGIAISALVVVVMNNLPGTTNWMPAITGIAFAIVLLVINLRLGLVRFYLIGLCSLMLGGGLSLAGTGDVFGLSIFYAGIGLLLLFSGTWVFLRYLNSTSRPEEESDAG